MRVALCLLAAVLAGTGCTHRQLRNNTIGQASTLADIHQQQVLDNLAMFVSNSDSLPQFAYPDGGNNQLTDTGSLTSTVAWKQAGFYSANVNPTVSRSANETWTLHPVNDPHKLVLMQCAYKKAVAGNDPSRAGCSTLGCDAR